MNLKKIFIWPIAFLCMGIKIGYATPLSKIIVEGNQRIESEAILNHVTLKVGDIPTEKEINENLKEIYKSDYFADVSLKQMGSTLVIQVVENPSINRIVFEGNKNVSDKILNTEMKIQPRQLLNKAKIQQEVQRILAIYRAKGYFGAKVTPQIITREQNRADVVFEIKEGKQAEVRRINFIGNRNISDDQLKYVLITKESKWWRFFASDDIYDPDRLEVDRENLRKLYLSKGYADFKVISAVAELVPSQDGFIITFTLEEGNRYKFGKVDVKSKIPHLKADELRAKLQAKTGDWYSSTIIEKDIEILTNKAGDLGYAFVNVRPMPVRDEKNRTITLTYQVEEGAKIFINKIKLIGNTRTVDSVIRRQFLVAEGDAFNASKLRGSDRKLQNLGYFKRVDLKQVPLVNDPEKADIEAHIDEKSTGEINFSAGYNTSDGPFGMITLNETNLFGRAYGFYSRVYYGKKVKSIDASLEDSYFLNKDLVAGVGVVRGEQNLESESSFKEQTLGFRNWYGYNLAEFLTQKWMYGLMKAKVGSVPVAAAPQIKAQIGNRTTSSITHTLSYDKRDFKFSPTEGYVTTLMNEFAGLGGTVKFFKTTVGGAVYYTPITDLTLSLNSELGFIQGIGQTLRVSDKFTLGGMNLRGFEEGGVGPHYKLGNLDALGGDRIFTTTLEASFPIGLSKDFGIKGSTFVDMGTTWDSKYNDPNVDNFKSLRMAAGFGIGWASPIGMIRVDFGFPIMKKRGDKTSVILVNFGTGRF